MASYPLSQAILRLGNLSDEELDALNEILETRLARHLYGKAKALRPTVETPAEAYEREVLRPIMQETEGGYGPEFCKAPEVKTWVATDLTLRCCACGSNVDKSDGVVRCFTCEMGKKS